MRRIQRQVAAALLAFALVFAAGCGGGRSAVKGKVSWNGAPVTEGTIGFVPKGGGERVSVSAPIKDGSYAVESGKGPNTGAYQVQIIWEKKTGKKVGVPGDSGVLMDEVKQLIPEYYNTKTTLEADIKSGENTLDYDLKPK